MNASTAEPAPGDASVVVRLRCAPELVELASDALWQAGTSAVSEEPADVVRGISAAESAPSAPAAVELTGEVPVTALADLRAWCGEVAGGVELEVVELDPAWADAWCEHARAYRVGPLVVRPVWVPETLAPGEEVVEHEGRDGVVVRVVRVDPEGHETVTLHRYAAAARVVRRGA